MKPHRQPTKHEEKKDAYAGVLEQLHQLGELYSLGEVQVHVGYPQCNSDGEQREEQVRHEGDEVVWLSARRVRDDVHQLADEGRDGGLRDQHKHHLSTERAMPPLLLVRFRIFLLLCFVPRTL